MSRKKILKRSLIIVNSFLLINFIGIFMNIAVYNNRGGVGKTTIASSIAFRAIERNKELVLIDADKQSNAMKWVSNDDLTGEDHFRLNEVDVIRKTDNIELDEYEDKMVVIDCPPEFGFIERIMGKLDVILVPLRGRFSVDGGMSTLTIQRTIDSDTRVIFIPNQLRKNHKVSNRQLEEIHRLGIETFKFPIDSNQYVEQAEELCVAVWNIPYSVRSGAVNNLKFLSDWVLNGVSKERTTNNANKMKEVI